jgi:DNA-binding NarL/FixJ family response regulator
VVVDWSSDAARATAARLTERCGPSLPAYSPAAAVSMVRRIRPRMVVTELNLPQPFVGVRLIRELREMGLREIGPMRIVVLTANDDFAAVAQAREAGADDVILKSRQDLDARLDAACALSGATAAGPAGV